MDSPPPFGHFIKARRLELGLTIRQAAKRSGIQPSRLHDLESGHSSTTLKATGPTRDNIRGLAQGYGLPEAVLFSFADRPSLEPAAGEELQLIGHFRGLSEGHRRAVLHLAGDLFRVDNPLAAVKD